jgi:hypothetical protein
MGVDSSPEMKVANEMIMILERASIAVMGFRAGNLSRKNESFFT